MAILAIFECWTLFPKQPGMDRSVMQLRQQVGEKLGRCVDEVKLIAFDRQLEAVGWYQTILVTSTIKNKIDLLIEVNLAFY